MKYYRIISETPYCGEDRTDYFATNNEKELHRYAQECCECNAAEWYDEDTCQMDDMNEEDYYNECNYYIEEIDYETWKEEMGC